MTTLGVDTPIIAGVTRDSVVLADNGSRGGAAKVSALLGLIQPADLPIPAVGLNGATQYDPAGAITVATSGLVSINLPVLRQALNLPAGSAVPVVLTVDSLGNIVPLGLGAGISVVNGQLTITSGGGGGGTITTPAGTRARFAQDTATAGVGGTAAALFASMVQVSGATTDRNGALTTTADQTQYTWVAVLASAAGAGERFFDGTGYGGFNGAQSASIYSGPDADPTTISQSYTDSSGNAWNLYRSSGHSVALTFTLS
jgi:hypothetical protein